MCNDILFYTGSRTFRYQVWDIATGTESSVLLGHKFSITALCLADDNSLLFSGDAGGTLMVWQGGTYDHIVTVLAHVGALITSIGYCVITEVPPGSNASRGVIIFTGASDGRVKAWRADTGAPWELQVCLVSGASEYLVYLFCLLVYA